MVVRLLFSSAESQKSTKNTLDTFLLEGTLKILSAEAIYDLSFGRLRDGLIIHQKISPSVYPNHNVYEKYGRVMINLKATSARQGIFIVNYKFTKGSKILQILVFC